MPDHPQPLSNREQDVAWREANREDDVTWREQLRREDVDFRETGREASTEWRRREFRLSTRRAALGAAATTVGLSADPEAVFALAERYEAWIQARRNKASPLGT